MARARTSTSSGARRALTVAAAVAGLALVGGGGSLIGAQSATFSPSRIPLVGRTSTVCTVGPAVSGSSATIEAVVNREFPGRAGSLTGTRLGDSASTMILKDQGRGRLLTGQISTMVLQGEGVMATASTGAVVETGVSGEQGGLMAAPCTVPATQAWLVGVGAEPGNRSELTLTNPDDTHAEVDIQFFAADGIKVVAGSSGVVIDGHSSRTLSLESLVGAAGPLSVSVQASTGRVSAVARDLRSDNLRPVGADWHTSSLSPSTKMIIPAIPEGAGDRKLDLVNPGTVPAQVRVQVLGQLGAFSPAGATTVTVPAGSTVSADLQAGLATQPGAVRLTSDQPISGAVVSTSQRPNAQPDIAIQPALPPVVRTGVVALATADGLDSELILSNGANSDAEVSLQVLSYDGVSLRQDHVLVPANSTSTRRLNSPAPSYLVVSVPDGSAVHGGVVLTQPDGAVAGLASLTLTSPDVATRAPDVVGDPQVGR
jgi:hypothetical protein